jgi:hypothetical protein
LAAVLNSFVLDFVARQKLGGTHMTYFILKQLAVPSPEIFDSKCPWSAESMRDWFTLRVLELSYTSNDLREMALELGFDHPPFVWSTNRRSQIMAELDAGMFILYGLSIEDVEHIMDNFFVLRNREEKLHGEFRTKRLIVERFEALQTASHGVTPYQTSISPPPGSFAATHV